VGMRSWASAARAAVVWPCADNTARRAVRTRVRWRAGHTATALRATETGNVRIQGLSGCRQHIESDYRRPERAGYWYVTLCLLPDGAASSMVSHLILESGLEIKIEKPR
jgi:hypothetical protein